MSDPYGDAEDLVVTTLWLMEVAFELLEQAAVPRLRRDGVADSDH